MKDKRCFRRKEILPYLLGLFFLVAAAVAFSPALDRNGQAAVQAQAVEITVDLARGMLAVTANLVKGEILSIEVMGPGSKLVVDEDVASSSFTWAPGAGDLDGPYRYEIQVVDKATGDMIGRKAGTFTIRDGEIKAPREISPPGKHKRQGMMHEPGKHLARAMETIISFFVPEAEAADLTAESSFPAIFFNDTNDEDCESPTALPWDWLIWTAGGVDSVDTANYFIIYGKGEAATGNCGNAVQILRLNHDGKAAPDSSRDSLVIDSTGDLRFAEDRMFFDRSASRLGIGTTTPGYTLDAIGDRIRLRNSTADDARTVMLRTDGTGTHLQAENADLYIRANTPAPAHNIYLLSDRVGIGTTSPTSKLHVVGATSPLVTVDGLLTATAFTGDGSGLSNVKAETVANGVYTTGSYANPGWMTSLAGSKITGTVANATNATTTAQIGANTTNYIPRWNGTQLVSGIIADNGSAATVNGSLSATSLVAFSDGRYKKNVEPLQLSLDKVTQLTGVSYEWKTEEYGGRGFEEGRHIGFIAEDVERVIPELVRTDEMGYKALAYDRLVPVLVEAVKQQQREIGEKGARIEKLERALEKLALRVAAIEGSAKNIAFK